MTMVSSSPPKVAVIGGGPGGMFFCHALETRRRELKENGDKAALASLPIVTCFERASGPGGVWRAERTFAADENKSPTADDDTKELLETTNMYEALWTNGSKENIEFYDYTFDEHFGRPLPVYMPRQPVLEYMVGRVTKHCPDFFEKYVKFNTNVVSVRFIQDKFEIVTKDLVTQELITGVYDKCIWAAGENGRPSMPAPMIKMFRDGGFAGRIIHSSDTANFEEDVKGKRVLLIGGAYSAEDLALMAVKVGAEMVYASSRQNENVVSWATSWPQNKVEILEEQTPVRVTEDGRCIQFVAVKWEFPVDYVPSEDVETEIRDIDTIIFCTGYKPNVEMLEEKLRVPFLSSTDKTLKLSVPKDWKMKPNKLMEHLGEIELGDVRSINSIVTYPGLYRGLSISNPAMMFLTGTTDNPLVCIDVNAWLLLRFITGLRAIPTPEDMSRQNLEDALEGMQNPYVRYCMDSNYYEAFDEKFKDEKQREIIMPLYEEYKDEHYSLYFRMLARSMQEAKYPVSFGTFEELNETAKAIISYDKLVYNHRTVLDPDNEEENAWRTYRDYTDAHKFCSTFTGTEAVPLPGRWIDLDATDPTMFKP